MNSEIMEIYGEPKIVEVVKGQRFRCWVSHSETIGNPSDKINPTVL